jgi:hypothetical protein
MVRNSEHANAGFEAGSRWEGLVTRLERCRASVALSTKDASLPACLRDALVLSPDETGSQCAAVSIEDHEVTASYLDFLWEQIELQARGPEWNAVLERRLRALERWVGQTLILLIAHCEHAVLFADIDPDTWHTIRWEAH